MPTGDPIRLTATVDTSPETAAGTRTIHSAMAGAASTWTVEIGGAVAQYAAASLSEAFPPGDDVAVQVDLVDYDVEGSAATTDLRFTVRDGEQVSFQRDYRGAGEGYGGRVFLGGVRDEVGAAADDGRVAAELLRAVSSGCEGGGERRRGPG